MQFVSLEYLPVSSCASVNTSMLMCEVAAITGTGRPDNSLQSLMLIMCLYYNIAHASALALARASRHSLIVYSDAFVHTGTVTDVAAQARTLLTELVRVHHLLLPVQG